MPDMKRAIKDSVFTFLFKEPEYALELYKTLHPEDQTVTEKDCRIITTENVLLNGIHNDLGILIRNLLILLVEAQSTFSLNIALRMLLYLATAYKDYVDENELDLYGSKAVTIPEPELYVVYTGKRENIPDTVYLSDLFPKTGNSVKLELSIRVLRYDGSKSIIDQYVQFCRISDACRRKYGYTQKAVEETVRICIENGILAPFLQNRKKEMLDMMTLLFGEERLKEIHEKAIRKEIYDKVRQRVLEEGMEKGRVEGRVEGRAEGRAEGRTEGREDAARLLMERFNLPLEDVKAALASLEGK